ncbi:cupin domain-containing protein [Rubrivivax gelatinosus]|uniref:cupin domain-containing protein n=1 Tax=Rubrivivax gelatinosus TaxID=28068 RepID=UPI0019089755|nr:cupin domain-containing protein [Rubrivivax gelatinosus]
MKPALPERAQALVTRLKLQPHPEGGHYAELYRSQATVQTARGERRGLTTIDFLLARGEHSAWHRVRSCEVWHLLEGGPLKLWLLSPDLMQLEAVVLDADKRSHVVPADWWQTAEPDGDYAYCGATVGPGFDFEDFAFGRDDAALRSAIGRQAPELHRLL